MESADELAFHPLKKIEIILPGEKQAFVRELLERSGCTGWTLFRDVAGQGHHGFHEGRLLWNDQASIVMFMAVGSEAVIRKVAAGLKPLFAKGSGVMFVSDTHVVRLEHFLSADGAD
ncbi:transcriptional regulator [Falsiroseomonas bella]|uniref:Nitrogen regulatory protein P-II n=1 Tax=Falsiroseomonas bella TaxID=2184016 RepID=A0A317F6H8_9PROT|nr:transcriptional regulator [Falsiroseomonas bella]PWS34811.1 transcriptional regulator [Falsiroseomonas bella]